MSLVPNVCVSLLNFECDRSGVRTRPGYTAYSNFGVGYDTTSIEGLYSFKKSDGNKYLIAVNNGAVFVETTTGIFPSASMTGLTAGYPWSFTTLANFAIGANGYDAPIKYNGTTCKALKVTAPSVAPNTAVGAAGVLTGNYQYKITFLSASGAETNGSSASTVLAPASQQVSISNIQTGGTDVTARYIYRTQAGGSIFYYLDAINDNTTTTYTDNISDSLLGTDTIPTNHDDPPAIAKFPTVYKEFLFVVDPTYPTRAYFSHQSFPEIFSTAEGTGYYMVIGLNDGEHIIGMRALRGSLYIFKERSTWPVVGSSPDDLKTTPQATTSSIGLYHGSMAYVDQGGGDTLVGLSTYGLYQFDGYSYRNIGVQKDVGIDITGFISGLDKNQLHKAFGFNDIEKNQYRCFVMEAGSSYNNKEIVWDYKRNSVFIFDRKGNCAVDWNGVVLFGSSTGNGKIYQVGGLNDNGTAITQTIEFPWWPIGDDFKVMFDRVNVDTTLQGNYSPTFTVYVDGSNIGHALSLNNGNAWGSSAWVTSGATYRAKVPLQIVGTDGVNLKGSYVKFRLTNSGLNQPITLNKMTLYYEQLQEYSGLDVDPTVLGSMGV